ncbi:MAG: lysostaphin resistance A-like protein [Candidatus Odinarchaeota archaeon]
MTMAIPGGLEKKITWEKNILLLRIGIFYATIIIILFALQLILSQFLTNIIVDADINVINNLLRGLTGIVGMLTCFLFLKYDTLRLYIIGLNNFQKSHIFFLIAGIITAVALIPTVIIEILFKIIPVEEVALLGNVELILLTILFSFAGISLGEEVIFRGYIQTVLETKYSFIKTSIVSAFLFGFLHFIIGVFNLNLIYMVTWGIAGFIFGIGMSYIYKITGNNLIIPIAIHGFWDAYLFLFQVNFEYNDWFVAAGEIMAQIVGVLIFCILTLVIVKKLWPEIMPVSLNSKPEL